MISMMQHANMMIWGLGVELTWHQCTAHCSLLQSQLKSRDISSVRNLQYRGFKTDGVRLGHQYTSTSVHPGVTGRPPGTPPA
jgi:hypothetical protein